MYTNTNKKTTRCLVLGGWVFKHIYKYKKNTNTTRCLVWGGWWVFKQLSANMGYHVRHHVANPLIAPPS